MGVDFVGGLDPTNVDGAMEKSLDAMFQIALDTGKGVDIHLHEGNPASIAAIDYMLDTVEKTPALKNRLTISHAFALADLGPEQLSQTAARLAENGVAIASTVPIGGLGMPLPQLSEARVFVMTGTDSVTDHWSPFANRAWPKPGDGAVFSLAPATCPAEAVARLPARTATFHKGRLVSGNVEKAAS